MLVLERVKRKEVRETYHECCYLASRDMKGKVLQNPHIRPCWVAETNPIDLDHTQWFCRCFSGLGKGVDRGLSVDENEEL